MPTQHIFPAKFLPSLSKLLPSLTNDEISPAKYKNIVANVLNERLAIPYRVYYEENNLRSIIKISTGENKILTLCLGTRHHNGFIREECLRQLILIDQPWVAPFVIQLLGEYVIEIIHFIAATLPQLNKTTYGEFVRQNPALIATTKKRIISYWDCYLRHAYPSYQVTPAFLALNAIEKMA
jgi:hypothetical protein